jgi:hypothetical protein
LRDARARKGSVRAKARDGRTTQVNVEIFDADIPVARERLRDASTGGPADLDL